MRAKHPAGRGLWPAIWMMPQEKSKSIGSQFLNGNIYFDGSTLIHFKLSLWMVAS